MNTSSYVRKKFLSFFYDNGHTIIKSAPLVPIADQSILFINSGMAPMKEFFLKHQIPPAKNLVNIQKCIRAGGKHNDLEDVGYTARHHTLFEMCGNFSFGGYGVSKAIVLAFRFLTEVLKMDQSKLWVTVHPDDEESYNTWRTIIAEEKIIKIPENTWAMGEEGPCGVCTEIFYDQGSHLKGNFYDGERFLELWNIVKISHEIKDGIKKELAQCCIDTGMGLERIVAVLENVNHNYKADLFLNVTNLISKISGKVISHHHNIIADHARAILFLSLEGIKCGNSGREYVLRRIIRRAALSERELGVDHLVEKSVKYISEAMKESYPEISDSSIAVELVKNEIENYKSACENGMSQLNKILLKEPKVINGEDLFKLYDTYGLPLDIVRDTVRNTHIKLDIAGFETLMQKSKDSSRLKARCNYHSDQVTTFVGYNRLQIKTTVLEVRPDAILTKETPFYPQGGGQIADVGVIEGKKWIFIVRDVKKVGLAIWHYGSQHGALCKAGERCKATVDKDKRFGASQHHSATHLLAAALRLVDPTISQKGSLVQPHRLRFDCNCPRDINLKAVEAQVNDWIQQNYPAIIKNIPKEDAYKMGAIGIFDDKYEKNVRVLKIGPSIELCGGTHVKGSGSIGSFYIIKTKSISSGIIRIEAVAGDAAYSYCINHRNILDSVSKKLSTLIQDIVNQKDPCKTVDTTDTRKI